MASAKEIHSPASVVHVCKWRRLLQSAAKSDSGPSRALCVSAVIFGVKLSIKLMWHHILLKLSLGRILQQHVTEDIDIDKVSGATAKRLMPVGQSPGLWGRSTKDLSEHLKVVAGLRLSINRLHSAFVLTKHQ